MPSRGDAKQVSRILLSCKKVSGGAPTLQGFVRLLSGGAGKNIVPTPSRQRSGRVGGFVGKFAESTVSAACGNCEQSVCSVSSGTI